LTTTRIFVAAPLCSPALWIAFSREIRRPALAVVGMMTVVDAASLAIRPGPWSGLGPCSTSVGSYVAANSGARIHMFPVGIPRSYGFLTRHRVAFSCRSASQCPLWIISTAIRSKHASRVRAYSNAYARTNNSYRARPRPSKFESRLWQQYGQRSRALPSIALSGTALANVNLTHTSVVVCSYPSDNTALRLCHFPNCREVWALEHRMIAGASVRHALRSARLCEGYWH